MLKQLWMSGILAAFLVFGVKIGLGLGAQIGNPTIARSKRWGMVAGCLCTYLLLFCGMYYVVTGFNLLNYLGQIAAMLKYGMILHFALALGLLLWGAKLLLQAPKKQSLRSMGGSLLLVTPCPVCAAVILLNLALAYSLFPFEPFVTTCLLFVIFTGIITITCGLILIFYHRIKSVDSFVGQSMALVSLYFVFTIIIAPIYPKIKAVFVMSVSNNPCGQIEWGPFLILAGSALALGGIGFYTSDFVKRGKH